MDCVRSVRGSSASLPFCAYLWLQMTVSIMRAIGPIVSNSLFSLSIDKGYLGGNLVYYILMGMVGMALYVARLLPQKPFA